MYLFMIFYFPDLTIKARISSNVIKQLNGRGKYKNSWKDEKVKDEYAEMFNEEWAGEEKDFLQQKSTPEEVTLDNGAKTNKIACDLCHKEFIHKKFLYIHKYCTHVGKKYHCNKCGESFSKKRPLIEHKVNCFDEKHLCHKCGKTFATKNERNLHMKCVHAKLRPYSSVHKGNKPFHCELCPAKFARNSGLLKHCQSVHPPDVYLQVNDLFKNQKNNGKLEKLQCNVCQETFTNRKHLILHLSMHQNTKAKKNSSKSYMCEICDKSFATMALLSIHQTLHDFSK